MMISVNAVSTADCVGGMSEVSEAQLPDAQARSDVLDVGGSFIVQAPAGSGKTTLLVERYLTLLGQVAQPEEILAITFTRKAAAEMRERVIQALANAQTPSAKLALQQSNAHGWGLLANPSRLRIQTIDSFAMGLVRRLPIAGQLDPATTISEHAQPLLEEAALRTLQRCFDVAHPLSPIIVRLLLNVENNSSVLVRALGSMLAKRDQWWPFVIEVLRLAATPGSLEQTLSAGYAAARNANFQNLCQQLGAADQELLRHVSETLTGGFEAEHLAQVARALVRKDGGLRSKLDRRQGFDNPSLRAEGAALLATLEQHQCAGLVGELARLPPLPLADEAQTELLDLCLVLHAALEELQHVFANHRAIDFTELMIAAQRALGEELTPTALALRLDYQLQHLLVDEFQDTSAAQLRLFELLIAGWQPDDGRTLFAVGDPMQSIYRFRDADVQRFVNAQYDGIADVQLLNRTLVSNFRSRPALVEWINNCFDADSHGFFARAQAMRPARSHTLIDIDWLDDASEEAEALVAWIQHHKRTSPEASIAVLLRTRSQAPLILKALSNAEIAWHGDSIAPLHTQPVVHDLQALVSILYSPSDRLHWATVLRSPLIGLPMGRLLALMRAADLDVALRVESNRHAGLKRLLGAIEYANRWLHEYGPREALEQLLTLAGYTAAYAPQARQAGTQFLRLLDELGEDCRDPILVTRAVAGLYADIAPSQDSGTVQIMTVHAAKGLEFDHVALPGLQTTPRQEGAGNALLLWDVAEGQLVAATRHTRTEGGFDWLNHRRRSADQEEIDRLLYVAMTRAKESLWLSRTGLRTPRESFAARLADVLAPYCPESPSSQPEAASPHDTEPTRRPPPPMRRLPPDFMPSEIHANVPPSWPFVVPEPQAPRRFSGTALNSDGYDALCEHLRTFAPDWRSGQTHWWAPFLRARGLTTAKVTAALEQLQAHTEQLADSAIAEWLRNEASELRIGVDLAGRVDGDVIQVSVDLAFVDAAHTQWALLFVTALEETDLHAASQVKTLVQGQWGSKAKLAVLELDRAQLIEI